jgi:colanic acid biosynthesis protein WcaH
MLVLNKQNNISYNYNSYILLNNYYIREDMEKNFIPDALYKKMQRMIPVVCVDIVVKTDNGILLGVRDRKGNPGRGLTWLIGGRVLYHENLEEAVKRKVKEETGLKVKIIRQIGVYTVFTKTQKRHNIAINYLVEKVGGTLKLNDEYSKFLFIKKADKKLHPYVYAVLCDSGVFGNNTKRLRKTSVYFAD